MKHALAVLLMNALLLPACGAPQRRQCETLSQCASRRDGARHDRAQVESRFLEMARGIPARCAAGTSARRRPAARDEEDEHSAEGPAGVTGDCLYLAVLQLGIAYDHVAEAILERHAELIPLDIESGLRELARLCEQHDSDACSMSRVLERPPPLATDDETACEAQRADPTNDAARRQCDRMLRTGARRAPSWLTSELRIRLAQRALSEYERQAPTEIARRIELLTTALRWVATSSAPPAQAFAATLHQRRAAAVREALEAAWAALDADAQRDPSGAAARTQQLAALEALLPATERAAWTQRRELLRQRGESVARAGVEQANGRTAEERLRRLEAQAASAPIGEPLFSALSEASTLLAGVAAEQRPALRERLEAVARALVQRHGAPLRARHRYAELLALLERLRPFGHEQTLMLERRHLLDEAGNYHAQLATQHLAARRPAIAYFHASRAMTYERSVDLAAIERELDAQPTAGLRVTLASDSVACPWLTLAAAEDGTAAASVVLRLRRCESQEQQWSTRDSYTYTTTREVEQSRVVTHESFGRLHCTPVPGSNGISRSNCVVGSDTVTNTVHETVQVPVLQTAERDTRHRTLHVALEGEFVLSYLGQSDTLTLRVAPADVSEEAYEQPASARRAFSNRTLDAARSEAAREALGLIQTGGPIRRWMSRVEAAALVTRATRNLAAPASEDALARAVLLSPDTSADALQELARRYALSPEETQRALTRRR